jgi:hypothetical protein
VSDAQWPKCRTALRSTGHQRSSDDPGLTTVVPMVHDDTAGTPCNCAVTSACLRSHLSGFASSLTAMLTARSQLRWRCAHVARFAGLPPFALGWARAEQL